MTLRMLAHAFRGGCFDTAYDAIYVLKNEASLGLSLEDALVDDEILFTIVGSWRPESYLQQELLDMPILGFSTLENGEIIAVLDCVS